MTYTFTSSPTNSFMTLDSANKRIMVSAGANDEGNYTITLVADDPWTDTSTANQTFVLQVLNNCAPTTNQTLPNFSINTYYPVDINWDETLFYD